MHRSAALALGLSLAVARPVTAQRAAGNPLPVPGRSMVLTRYGIVAASQPLAAKAGVEILERGGNAVDAAIATNAMMGLVEPAMNGIGGDLFVLYYEARSGRLYGLNSSGWAPTGFTPEFLAAKNITRMPNRGIYSVTVPGAVAGWDALRSRFGSKPFSELLAPAIFYAKEGFPVTQVVAETWAADSRQMNQPAARATYFLDGHTPHEGEIFRNLDLAQSLSRIAEHGRDGFYTGPTADALVAFSREQGGTMTAADLRDFQPEWVDPISTTYHGWTVYEMPPNSQGIAALMMLNIMERYPLADWGFHSTRVMHVMIEAKKLAYEDMLHYVGDPKFSTIPVPQLLDKAMGEKRAAQIDMAKANCSPSPVEIPGVSDSHGGDTIYLTVIDKDGNIVSLIQSNYSGFGSGLVAPGTGFALQNRGGLFTLQPGRPNTLAPRKRPLHTIIPAFMTKGDVKIGFGIMGGWNQSQAHAQFVSNIVDYGMTLQQALEAGRFTKGSFQGCDVNVEALVPAAVRDSLVKLGHDVRVIPPRSGTFGWGQAVMSTADGVHYGASEPRHDGAAIPQGAPAFGAPRNP